ncbi:MAG: pteridine reductase, partial [Gammaproteobacteria bacterium]|nr:pteridine reductase [Gammaproteobacteria bacterium]
MNPNSPANPEDKVAIVTGAARRIGAAIVGALHNEGMRVAIHYRHSGDEANTLCARLNAARAGSAACFRADLIEEGAPARLLDEVMTWAGSLDLLVNNASSFYPTPLGSIDEAAWNDLVGSNLKAPLFLSQAAAPALRASRGSIVNIVDIHARRPLKDHHVYGAAKAGLIMLTRSLAKSLAPEVRVNAIAPGAIEWPEYGMSDDIKSAILGQIPLGRPGSPS